MKNKDREFLRYSCQIALPGFTEATQKKLQNARVLIVGAGGLGCPAAQYLASTGIGTLGIADDDIITIGNLHRQILFNADEVGMKKVVIACKKLHQQNPAINIVPHDMRITSENVMDTILHYDIVLDGTDNFDTKYLLNDACVLSNKVLVHGAIYQYEGQVAVWNVRNSDGSRSPNYRDVFPDLDGSLVPDCAEGGVIPTLAGIIGCIQANEVIKYITEIGDLLSGRLLLFDSKNLHTRIINIGVKTQTHIKNILKTEVSPTISVLELQKKIKSNNVELIDLRTLEERENFNIGGQHMPIQSFDYENFIVEKQIPIILYCASGKRSNEVVKKLKHLYPESQVFSLAGGLKAWKEESVID